MANMTIWQAARSGDVEKVRAHLAKSSAEVNQADPYGFSPLHWAAQKGSLEIVKLLLDARADLDIRDADGQTPLHWAVDKGHFALVKLLVEAHADLNAQDKYKHTALHRAAALGQTEVVRYLLSRQADVNLQNQNGWSALHVACYYFHQDIVRALVERNIDLNIPNKDGWTPLHCVAMQGYADLAALLLQHQAQVNYQSKDGNTPLHLACQENRTAVVKVLVQGGAALQMVNLKGKRPIDCASAPDIVKILTDAMAAPPVKPTATPAAASPAATPVAAPSKSSRAAAGHSGAAGPGLTSGQVGQACMFVISARDGAGAGVSSGGETWQVLVDAPDGSQQKASVVDMNDGTYRVSFVPTRAGAYVIAASLYGVPLRGSPFRCVVSDPAAAASPRPEPAKAPGGSQIVAAAPASADTQRQLAALQGEVAELKRALERQRTDEESRARGRAEEHGRELAAVSASLEARAADVQRLERQLADEQSRAGPLAERERALAERERTLADKERLASAAVQDLQVRERQAMEKERMLLDRERLLGEKERQALDKEAALAQREKQLLLSQQQLHNASPSAAETRCAVCRSGSRDTLLLPCLHLLYCRSCAPRLDACQHCAARPVGFVSAKLPQ